MNGFEALKLMKQGKKVVLASRPELIYGLSNGFIGIVDEYGCFVEDTLFNFRLEYKEYIGPKRLTGWERVEGDSYETIASTGAVDTVDFGYYMDVERYETANYFSTKEKAEEIDFKQTLFRKLQRFSDENGGNRIDWSNKMQLKYCIMYEYKHNSLDVFDYSVVNQFGQVYFISRKVAEQAIELFHDDLIKYFTHDFGGSK